jgi:hypothetical protein
MLKIKSAEGPLNVGDVKNVFLDPNMKRQTNNLDENNPASVAIATVGQTVTMLNQIISQQISEIEKAMPVLQESPDPAAQSAFVQAKQIMSVLEMVEGKLNPQARRARQFGNTQRNLDSSIEQAQANPVDQNELAADPATAQATGGTQAY